MALSIEGMSCASCVGNVERALLALPGVQTASVSLMSKSGKVAYDTRRVDVPAIMAKVAAVGYRAEVAAQDEEQIDASAAFVAEADRSRRMFLGSLAFTLPVFATSMVLRHLTLT
mmetsp:Transcript_52773/g.104854  ORF Transcript_52773/g.104854 Transcript_52773/m.104854 type:complete len:115 (-) Transcript_52773:137-481(-)